MNSFVNGVNRANKVVYTVEKILAMIGMIALVALVTIQVVARYVFHVSTPWSEELARYVFLWTTYIGCGMCFSKKKHVVIDLIDELGKKMKNPKKFAFYVEKATMVASLVFLVIFGSQYLTVYYMKIARMGRTSTAINLPMVIPYASVLAGSLLMIWHAFVILIQPPIKE